MKKFSILTPCYNGAAFLHDWCDSILIQDYRPLQVVFVNDASTDNSLQIVNDDLRPKLEAKGIELVVVTNTERKFCGTCSKLSWQNANGDYFGFLDCDDMLAPGAVEYVANLYEKYQSVGYIYTQFSIRSRKMRPTKEGFSSAPQKGSSLLDLGKKGLHGLSHWRTFSNRMPKPRKLFQEGLRSAVDKYFAYRAEEQAVGLFAKRVCYWYRFGTTNAISRKENPKKKWKDIIKETIDRRKKGKIKPFRIITHKG